ncbi:MAG: hypothetical protein D6704_04485 [Nitrospirae bacterium]|nr:MAG: hypothetical protein D6704_04485 [Nitrospirota bacterium]
MGTPGNHLAYTMAEKFGNFRWVKEGYLDNRTEGIVVGHIVFAAIGSVEFYLKGNFGLDLYGRAFSFRNSRFLDDERALERLADFPVPHFGTVSLISFDPHPLVPPHPYIEWFSLEEHHYRIELAPCDAWILTPEELQHFEEESMRLRAMLPPTHNRDSTPQGTHHSDFIDTP